MKNRAAIIITTILVAVVIFAGIFGYKVLTIRRIMAQMAKAVPPPITVSVAAAREEDWPNTISVVGALASFRGIEVRTELEGVIKAVSVESGSNVKQGDLLVQLDTSMEEAQLQGLQAQAKLAENNLSRVRELRTKGTNSPSDLDTAEAQFSAASSAIAQLQVTIAKKHVSAPFDGRVGIVQVYPGQYLTRGEAIAILETINPIYADFSVPQQEFARIVNGLPIQITVDAQPGKSFEGKINAISPRVSDATRSLDVRAVLSNQDELLRPGMFARIDIVLPQTEHSLVLPAAAVVHNPYGETVYVVDKGVAQQRFIKTGPQRGDLIMVRDGLKVGEQVVTSGQVKLRNGTSVQIDNSLAPDANPAPHPQES